MMSNKTMFRSDWTYFVGREQELDMLRQHTGSGSARRWLHIYGQSGIGKSTLLRRFLSETEECRCHFIDGSKVIQEKEVLEQLSAQLLKVGETNHAVLLIDAFDQWHAIEHLFLEWLAKLEGPICIVTAGRNALTGGWLRSGWADSIQTIQLKALSAVDVERYAKQRGLSKPDDQTKLYRFSGGVPLAMAIATETILKGGESKRFERAEQYQLISVLMQDLLQGLPASVHRMLEAASVYWRFNEERLSAVMNTEPEPGLFRQFASLPFVMMKEDGWMLHDAVRAWVLEDYILRKPNSYELMRRNALLQIRKEERLHPQLRNKLQIDKMSLHEHPIVRAICFSGHLDDKIELRQCRQSDLPAVRNLYIQFFRSSSPTPDEEPPMHNLLQDIWEVDPASFVTIWKQNELIGFFGKVPMHDRMLEVLRREPLLKPFLRVWQPIPNSYLFAIIGIQPELEGNTRAYIINTLINHFSRSEWILDFTCLKEWFPVFELCGFERASWADAISAKGTEYRAFVLDLRQEDFLAKLDRSVSLLTATQTSAAPTAKPDIQELKNILKHWSVLPRKPALSQTYARLFPHRAMQGASDKEAGYFVQKDLEEEIRRMAEGDESQELFGKLLAYVFLEKIRPHERVAKRLNVSIATYYRHFNKALELLYQSLDSGEARSCRNGENVSPKE